MSNMQNNYYGFPWQPSSQQMNYGQFPPPYMNQQPVNFTAAPPPPPPPENNGQQNLSMQAESAHQNPRKQNNNFNNQQGGFNDSMAQRNNNNRQQNFNNNQRGNRNRGAGNQRGHGRFPGDNNHMQNPSNSSVNNSEMQNNFSNQRGGKNMNKNNRGGNNNNSRANWMKNNKNNNNNRNNSNNNTSTNSGPNIPESTLNQPLKFAHEVPKVTHQQPSFSFSSSASSSASKLEEEFKRWEEQFEKWLNEMKDHPDKQQYQRYKDQFMQYRETLMARIQKLKEKSISNPPMTDEQIKFSTEWSAGDPSKTEKPSTETAPSTSKAFYDPKTAPTQLPPPSFSSISDLPASTILFGSNKKSKELSPESFTQDEVDDFQSFAHKVEDKNYSKEFQGDSLFIPGLSTYDASLETNAKFAVDEQENEDVIILDESVSNKPRTERPDLPPPLPTFCRPKSRFMINIDDILEEPGRSNRSDKIMILIRGAPGSGKHHLANLIMKREADLNNDRCKIFSIRNFFKKKDVYENNRVEEFDSLQFDECKEMIQEGYINFAIVVLNGCGIKHFNRLSHMASTGKYDCYSIEIHQTQDVCQKYSIYDRSIDEIRFANEDLLRFSTPIRIKLLDPTSLYYPKEKQPVLSQPLNFDKPPPVLAQPTQSFKSNIPENAIPPVSDDFAKKMAQILQNENVLQLLQAHMNNSQPPPMNVNQMQRMPPPNFPQNRSLQPQRPFLRHEIPPQPNLNLVEECPIFKPSKVLDYNHVHKQTFEESLMEFKVFRTIDYNHMTSKKLMGFVFDVDLDKIIEKRKAIALRKKILEYLRSAERPEDTVSNPKYPRNWEIIIRERPPRKSKRRKRLTAKIRRVLLEKSRDENSWMTKGYVRDENEQMDLEAISSDDDDSDMDEKPAKKIKLEPPKPEYQDEFKDIFKTIPDFNRFNHPKMVNVKKILYMPDRRLRPQKILIIMRGAPGSGKSHLVQLIKRKESEMGNTSNLRILSIDDYYLTEEDEERDEKTTKSYLENIQKHLRKTICDNLHNFIIIDAENCDLNSYNQFHQIGSSMGFAVYTIELYQTLDICLKQSKRLLSSEDISKSIELLNKNRIPVDHNLLIPTALYEEYKCFVNPALSSTPEKPQPEIVEENTSEILQNRCLSIKNYQNYLVQTISDDYLTVMPQFNWHNRDTVDIRDVLEEPGRSKRTKNIAILIRGPGGSGKNELASMILSKERDYGNENVTYLSVEDFFINETTKKYEFNARDIDSVIQKLIRKLLELMRSKSYNFIVLDIETGDFSHYMQIYELLSKQNQCYTIETYQDASVCAENDLHKRPIKEIEDVLEEMNLNPTPSDHVLLDASMFYKHQPDLSEKPKKSALKISPNTSINVENLHVAELEKIYDSNIANASLHDIYQAIFNQRISVDGKFIERNSVPPPNLPEFNWFNVNLIDMRELLEEPGRNTRPEKIVIFIRGAPASGKTYLARLIERREMEFENDENFQLLLIDALFETIKYRETDFDGQYEKYVESHADSSKIDTYMQQLIERFTSVLDAGDKSFIVIDGDFCDLKYYNEMRNKAISSGFSCYTIELNQDDSTCLKFNDHKWNDSFILERNKKMQEIQTPEDHKLLDPEYLYHEYKYEFYPDGDLFNDQLDENEDDVVDEDEFSFGKFKMSAQSSKWDDYEAPDKERLDGIKTKTSQHVTMADYLQTDDAEEWSMRPSQSGSNKKRVRWADIEEKKAQEHMRKIGFIVGHTDWNRMTDESDGKSALEKTKFIEPRQKK